MRTNSSSYYLCWRGQCVFLCVCVCLSLSLNFLSCLWPALSVWQQVRQWSQQQSYSASWAEEVGSSGSPLPWVVKSWSNSGQDCAGTGGGGAVNMVQTWRYTLVDWSLTQIHTFESYNPGHMGSPWTLSSHLSHWIMTAILIFINFCTRVHTHTVTAWWPGQDIVLSYQSWPFCQSPRYDLLLHPFLCVCDIAVTPWSNRNIETLETLSPFNCFLFWG